MKQFILGKTDTGQKQIAVDTITELSSRKRGDKWLHFARVDNAQFEIERLDYRRLNNAPVAIVPAPAGFKVIRTDHNYDEAGKRIGFWFTTTPVVAWEINADKVAWPITVADFIGAHSLALIDIAGAVIDLFEPGIRWPSILEYMKQMNEQFAAEEADSKAA